MSDEIKPISLLYMWLLVTRGGEEFLKNFRPEFKTEYRRPISARELITEEKVGGLKKIILTDAGWHYLATHMTDSIINGSAATSSSVLQGVLAAMQRHMQETEVNLATLFAPPAKTDTEVTAPGKQEPGIEPGLWNRLRRSWKELQEADDGIRLDKLRPAFPDVPRERLDQALGEWRNQGKIVIYPFDDGAKITPEVKKAALKVSGRDLHIIYQK